MTTGAGTGPWTERTQGLTPHDHQQATLHIRQTLATVAAATEERGLTGWLLLGGSLARGEAAVDTDAGDGRPISDFDLYAVAPESERAGYLAAVSTAGATLPESQLSVFHVLPTSATRLGSYFGQDAVLGTNHVVHANGPRPRLAARSLSTRSDIEVIVHQASNLLLHDELAGTSTARRCQRRETAVKLILETCRVLARRPGAVSRLQDAVGSARTCGLRHEVIRLLLTERNTGRQCDIDVETLLPGVIRAALTTLAGGPLDDERLARMLSAGPAVMSAYQLLVLSQASRMPAPSRDLERLARAATVPAEARAIEGVLHAETDPPCGSTSSIQATLTLRRAYYARLGPHNFGNKVMEEYDHVHR